MQESLQVINIQQTTCALKEDEVLLLKTQNNDVYCLHKLQLRHDLHFMFFYARVFDCDCHRKISNVNVYYYRLTFHK